MKLWILIAALSVNMVIAAPADKALAARTPAQHRELATQYEQRADSLEAKAKKHEAKAAELATRTTYNPMAHKWPAMAQAPIDRERNLAMQARRAAEESRTLAARHVELAKDQAAVAE